MIYERWDVIVISYPFIDISAAKRRPALVLSSPVLQREHNVCLAAMITTARGMQDVRKYDIPISVPSQIGLDRPCVVRLSRIMTVEFTETSRRIGSLGRGDRGKVETTLRVLLPR